MRRLPGVDETASRAARQGGVVLRDDGGPKMMISQQIGDDRRRPAISNHPARPTAMRGMAGSALPVSQLRLRRRAGNYQPEIDHWQGGGVGMTKPPCSW